MRSRVNTLVVCELESWIHAGRDSSEGSTPSLAISRMGWNDSRDSKSPREKTVSSHPGNKEVRRTTSNGRRAAVGSCPAPPCFLLTNCSEQIGEIA